MSPSRSSSCARRSRQARAAVAAGRHRAASSTRSRATSSRPPATARSGPGRATIPTEGFQFSLGHGVGLEVHEEPSLGQVGREPLVAGDVLARRARDSGIAEIGGVRFEDLLLVTADGCETLTDYPY